ncbi:MAG: molybdopterin molybdenumtransferase MoeA [Chloroflexi bacterium]|nr:MAG: molybdopterin molybdenumtransferase MoeA [Chloroflexota bacterium]
MPEFLQLLPPTDALAVLLNSLPVMIPPVEEVNTNQALGRVTGGAVVSPEPLPAFSRSTVDGYAVRARDIFGASETLPVYLSLAGEVPMGGVPAFSLSAGQAALIHTGGMLPEGADAVIMIEHTQVARPGAVEALRAVAPGENELRSGEAVAAGPIVLFAGTCLGPAEIGGLMALGLTRIPVVTRPRVAILSSGDEVIEPEQTPRPGQVRDINSYTLSALVEQHGGCPQRYGIIPDRREALEQVLRRALGECDVVIITAGSSASTRDLTAEVIDTLGPPGVLVHGVNVKPGKPTILAVCQDLAGGSAKPVIGLPGNPVSALVIAGLFVVPVVERLLGVNPNRPRPLVPARLSVNLPSQAGREDWIPVKLVKNAAGYTAEPIFYKSNLIFTLAQADGMLLIPPDATGLEAGAVVEVFIL